MELTKETKAALRALAPLVIEHGMEGASELVRILYNEAAVMERQAYLGAERYERTPLRTDHANGFKPKSLTTRHGVIEVAVPQVRQGPFYPTVLERGTRVERAINLAMAEMYVQGISTRKVIGVLQTLLGPAFELSSTQVSRATQALDEGLQQWRTRPLGATPYVMVDARYEQVRHEGSIVDMAVLVAMGVDDTGKRRLLGISVAASEAEAHWRRFLESLLARGLVGVQLIVGDNHAGLKKARMAVLPAVPWQRCQVHLQRNAMAYVRRVDRRAAVARALTDVFRAPNRAEAERLLRRTTAHWRAHRMAELADWAEQNVTEGFTVFAMPIAHRVRLRTTNALERINRELKRRTRVVSIFPNPASCERLISALLAEVDEDWQAGKIYLNMKTR